VIVDHQAIGQFHQGGGRSGFRRVDSAGDVVDGRRCRDQFFRLRVIHVQRPRIAKFGEAVGVFLQFGHQHFGRDGHRDHLAAFFGLADRKHFDAGARFFEHPHVLVDLFGVGQFVRCARDVAKHRLRRRNRLRRR
jgi:hypothetical protein